MLCLLPINTITLFYETMKVGIYNSLLSLLFVVSYRTLKFFNAYITYMPMYNNFGSVFLYTLLSLFLI